MKKIAAFKTSDGEIFSNKEDAKAHEAALEPEAKEIPFILKDADGQGETVEGKIIAEDFGISIMVDGYGNSCSEDGKGTPIFIERYENELKVLVWSDINQEDATHRISMEDALEEKRRED